jgi:NAD(P)-dependent dehydrogenase (short-subunit alcohol dehydrogenase family)
VSLPRVVVLGAGGELGARVCRLVARAGSAAVIGVSRSARGPAGVTIERGDVEDAASIARLLRAGDLVVNCVGPFHYDPGPLVRVCATARAHYCDLADDVAFVEGVRAAAREAGALLAGVCVCPGASTVPGLVGVIAQALARAPRADEITHVSAYLSVGSANPVSAGLLASMLAPLGRAAAGGSRAYSTLRGLRASDGRTLRFGSYPAAFANGRVAVGAVPAQASFYFGFDRAPLASLLHLASRLVARIPRRALPGIAAALLPFARALGVFGTPRGLLVVVGENALGGEIARIELAATARGLDIPAAPPAWIVARLARDGTLPGGARELSDLVSLADVVRWVRADAAYALHERGLEIA